MAPISSSTVHVVPTIYRARKEINELIQRQSTSKNVNLLLNSKDYNVSKVVRNYQIAYIMLA